MKQILLWNYRLNQMAVRSHLKTIDMFYFNVDYYRKLILSLGSVVNCNLMVMSNGWKWVEAEVDFLF